MAGMERHRCMCEGVAAVVLKGKRHAAFAACRAKGPGVSKGRVRHVPGIEGKETGVVKGNALRLT